MRNRGSSFLFLSFCIKKKHLVILSLKGGGQLFAGNHTRSHRRLEHQSPSLSGTGKVCSAHPSVLPLSPREEDGSPHPENSGRVTGFRGPQRETKSPPSWKEYTPSLRAGVFTDTCAACVCQTAVSAAKSSEPGKGSREGGRTGPRRQDSPTK